MDATKQIRDFFEEVSPDFAGSIHPYAARRRGEALSLHAKGDILEVGCGSGAVTTHLARKGRVVAGDVAHGMVRQTCASLRVPGVVFDGCAFPFRDHSFDTVACAEAIYYLNRPLDLIREAHRILRPGGLLALTCMVGFWQRVDRTRIRLGRLGLWIGSEVPPLPNILPQHEVKRGIVELGFALQESRPMILFPSDRLDGLNRWLERTPLGRGAIFWVLTGEKR
ncbi:MAG: methyltransferase domain-containing protein [Nitrospirae bacterium]|nr:methyltransferase domain-containing protein [Nitrospirota bacterium]